MSSRWPTYRRPRPIPPGSWGYPWLGVLPQMRRERLGFLSAMVRTYGDIVALPCGPMRVSLLCHPAHGTYGATLPEMSHAQATCATDQDAAAKGARPAERPQAMAKQARTTTHSERGHTPLRQHVSRWVRETLAFSTTVAHHSGAMRSCICHDNRTSAAACPLSHSPRTRRGRWVQRPRG
jgi:hypothetical protein